MLDGAYDGDVSFAELAERGDFGLGTLNGCDGEMIAIDGRFLRADASGAIIEVPPEAKTPFAVLTHFEAAHRFELGHGLDFDRLSAEIDRRVGAPEIVHAVRIDGRFRSVRCRSVPKQRKPYRPLAEVVAEQRVFSFPAEGAGRATGGVEGTMVGFRFPNLGLGIGVPGYHLHFITADRARGGHVLDCEAERIAVEIGDLSDLYVETPPGVEIGSEGLGQAQVDAIERD
jgi:acetolactate decarboxylase